ncbi:hypothetical protein ACLB2K_015662 [Fragaria x ananassa]
MENLNNILKDQGSTITSISDCCKGYCLMLFPNSPHGYCLHHFQKNLRNKYPNSIGGASFHETIVSMFNYCAYASIKEQFAEELSRFKKVGGKIAVKFLASLPDENWSNAYFPGKSWVKEERELPIYELVDGIHLKVMKMNSAILKNEDNPYDYTDDYFSVSDFKESYSHHVLPILDFERVADSDNDHGLKPPLTKIPPGRPKRKRIPSNGENSRPIKCGRCGSSERHNRKSCIAKI